MIYTTTFIVIGGDNKWLNQQFIISTNRISFWLYLKHKLDFDGLLNVANLQKISGIAKGVNSDKTTSKLVNIIRCVSLVFEIIINWSQSSYCDIP